MLQSFWTCAFTHYSYLLAFFATNNASYYRKSPARSRAAYIQARLVEWVYKPWLLFDNIFQLKSLGGLFMKYSIFLFLFIYKPRLVTRVAYIWERLIQWIFFQTNISPAASGRGLLVRVFLGWSWTTDEIHSDNASCHLHLPSTAFNKQWCGKFLNLPHDKRGRIHRVETRSGC